MKRLKKALFSVLAVVFWLALWQVGAMLSGADLLIPIPTFTQTIKAFAGLCGTGAFWNATLVSLWHILAGYLASVLLGGLFGMLSGALFWFKTLSAPIVHLMRAVPVAAIIVVAWLWIPSAMLPSVIAFLMVLPIIWSHVDAGLLAVDPQAVELCRVYGMPRREILWRVRFRYAEPSLRTGCVTGLSIAWKAGVAAEIICNPTGSLGSFLQKAKASVEYADVFAVTLMVVVLSLILENALKLIWKEQRR